MVILWLVTLSVSHPHNLLDDPINPYRESELRIGKAEFIASLSIFPENADFFFFTVFTMWFIIN